jgi:hypothetical protein
MLGASEHMEGCVSMEITVWLVCFGEEGQELGKLEKGKRGIGFGDFQRTRLIEEENKVGT